MSPAAPVNGVAYHEQYSGLRGRLQRVVEHPRFPKIIMAVILVNAVTLGMETSPTLMAGIGDLLLTLDRIALAIFTAEILVKLFVYRGAFWRQPWNWFDFAIVAISLAPAAGNLSVLRAFRILRVLRLLSVVPQMRAVIAGLLRAIPGMSSVIAVLVLVFYVAGVLSTKLFGTHADPNMQEWFGSIGASMYTLFQIMTLESWSMGIVRPTMELFPWSWLFFVPFIIITSFAVLNLFIGIIVDAMQTEHAQEREAQEAAVREAAHEDSEALAREIRALRADLAAVKAALGVRGDAAETQTARPDPARTETDA